MELIGKKILKDLVDRKIGYGIVQPGQNVDNGIPVIKVNNIISGLSDVNLLDKTTVENSNKYKRTLLQGGELLISLVGSVGKTAIVPKSFSGCNLVRATGLIDIKNPLICKWTKYFIDSKYGQTYINNNLNTTVQPTLNIDSLEKMEIPFFQKEYMEKAVNILHSLDDKIELNNKINENLEQQAQALFKNWFVDFEPFGGKMPEGWKEADIYSIANIIYGSPFASKLFNTEKNGKPIIRIRDLKDQHSDVYTPEERDDAYLIQPKDIVVGMDGEFRPYIWGSEPGWLNQRVCVFENKRPKGKAFLFFSIKPLLDVVEKTQVATTVIHIGKKDFDKFQITLPTEDILDKFDELTDPILDQIVANRLENRRLAELRDTLLPKLMNGEIEVNEVRI